MEIIGVIQTLALEVGPITLGLLAGWLVERLLLRSIAQWTAGTKATWDDVLASSLRYAPIFWGGLLGVWGTLNNSVFLEDMSQQQMDQSARLLVALWIASGTMVLMRFAGGLVAQASRKRGGFFPGTSIVEALVKIIIAVFGAFLILQNLDIDITPLITALGIGGLAVALALQDTLGNLFAGIQIILSRQVRPFDYIQLESGEEGYVTDVQSRHTTIRTFPGGNLVVIPNSRMAGSIVKNYTLPQKTLWVTVEVGVHYSSDLAHVERVAMEVAQETLESEEGALTTQDPQVLFQEFGESSIDLVVRLFVREFVEQFRVRHEFIKRLHARFRDEGIVIPFPIRTLDLPEGTTISVDRVAPADGDSNSAGDAEQ